MSYDDPYSVIDLALSLAVLSSSAQFKQLVDPKKNGRTMTLIWHWDFCVLRAKERAAFMISMHCVWPRLKVPDVSSMLPGPTCSHRVSWCDLSISDSYRSVSLSKFFSELRVVEFHRLQCSSAGLKQAEAGLPWASRIWGLTAAFPWVFTIVTSAERFLGRVVSLHWTRMRRGTRPARVGWNMLKRHQVWYA